MITGTAGRSIELISGPKDVQDRGWMIGLHSALKCTRGASRSIYAKTLPLSAPLSFEGTHSNLTPNVLTNNYQHLKSPSYCIIVIVVGLLDDVT